MFKVDHGGENDRMKSINITEDKVVIYVVDCSTYHDYVMNAIRANYLNVFLGPTITESDNCAAGTHFDDEIHKAIKRN